MAPQFDLTVELRPATTGTVSGLIEYDTKVVAADVAEAVARHIRTWFDEEAAA
jgi:hypothetical protein